MARFVLLTIFTVFVFSLHTARSQYYFYNDDYYDSPVIYELGVSIGGMNCLTDLGGKKGIGRKFIKDINWNATRLCGSIYAGVTINNIIAARVEFSGGELSASDNILKDDRSAAYGRFVRNLSFRSSIAEASLVMEFHPLPIISNNGYLPALSPYILAGVGVFAFCPETFYDDGWIRLPTLHTEGQGFDEYRERKAYKLTQLNIPLGCGIKYEVSARFTLRLEVVYRKLWTDYLDDVSKTYVDLTVFDRHLAPSNAVLARKLADRRLLSDPDYTGSDKRGNEKNNDAYFTFHLKTGLMLGRQRRR